MTHDKISKKDRRYFMKQKKFSPDTVFESNTTYVADRETYHIFPNQTDIRCWWTTVSSSEDALCAAFVLRNLENVVIDLGGLYSMAGLCPLQFMTVKMSPLKTFQLIMTVPFLRREGSFNMSRRVLPLKSRRSLSIVFRMDILRQFQTPGSIA